MAIDYSYLGITELLKRIEAIDQKLDNGSVTSVGIAAGIRHEFATLDDATLRRRRDEYAFALFELDPATYPNPYNRPGITRAAFCR